MTDPPTSSHFSLSVRQQLRQSELVQWLTDAHYSRIERVATFGQFAVLGDLVVLQAVNHPRIVQIDFLGDAIEHISDILDDKTHRLDSLSIAPNVVDADGIQFEPGQFVVHLDHGIGQFQTLGMRQVNDVAAAVTPYSIVEASSQNTGAHWLPFLIIDYAQGGQLFVPPDQAEKLTHYIGSRAPTLSTLGSKRWQTTRRKVEEDLLKLSRDLLLIAANRQLNPRPAHQIQHDWLKILADQFAYVETDDQAHAISAVLSDLTLPKPMDRLICGDVGFGKTEIALRASAAVVSAGKQVVLLAPTTLLVAQHVATFQARLKDLPITVEPLSRFESVATQQQTLGKVRAGTLDIVIGTHRLLGSDVAFADLGLVIIDEEQKFGVKAKEQLKKLRAEVDVLTLSATPIPRTLFSGLSGLRDISLLTTPPHNRLPIETHIQKSDDAVLADAVKREVARGGQVFIVHNDVVSIEIRAGMLRKLLPDVHIAVSHGQMPEQQLARVMADMIGGSFEATDQRKRIDCLLTSTIIESGLDMPNVNTLIVEKCDRFGLADLYQLRGRVGRSKTQAYAYFFYDSPELTRTAKARFTALAESTELGSGYSIALRDLEIRGGGNILGKQQHGNMEAVGLSLYTKLLQLTVNRMRQGK